MLVERNTQLRLQVLGCAPCVSCGARLQLGPGSDYMVWDAALNTFACDGFLRLPFRAFANGVLCDACAHDDDKHMEARRTWESAEHRIRTAQRPGEHWREYVQRILREAP